MLLNDVFQKHPAEKTAFIFKDQFTTYGEFRKKVLDWAVFLQSQGVKRGDRVGFSVKIPRTLWLRILPLSKPAAS